ncbi:hypothetical protein [Hydrogenobacter thermophilus]|uniref:hypothetical protein n=1 Tax=Hydrogenobacter thermophilus TaxID=940 RepID=UPI0030FADDC4
MSIRFLLLDEERKFFSFVSDIFDVTGHKLLVALDEQKAKDLLDATSFDILLAEIKHFNFWLDTVKGGKYLIPIFLLENYEDAEKLKALGFTDLNFVLLPFNPLDLLTKAVWLNREEFESKVLSSIGPMNLLLHLLRRRASSIMTLDNNSKKCSIYLRDGQVSGTTCEIDDLKEILSSTDIKIELFPYTGENYLEEGFGGNEEFFSKIFSQYTYAPQEKVTKKASLLPKGVDLTQPVELYKGLFWVGLCDDKFLLHFNSYLRVYEKEDVKVPLLINAGSPRDYVQIRTKIEEILSTTDIIKAVVVLSSYEYANSMSMLQSNPKLQIITSLSIAKQLYQLGIPTSRIRVAESLPDMKLKLSTGDTLRIIPVPFAPEKGSFMIYEEETGFLFTSHIFSSLCTPQEFSLFEDPNIEDVTLYMALSMPCSRSIYKALDFIEDLRVSKVFPTYGNPIDGETLKEVIKALRTTDAGIDLPSLMDEGFYLQALNKVLAKLKEEMAEGELLSLKAEFEKYAYLEDLTIKEALVSPSALVGLFIASMQYIGVDPYLIKRTIKELFYEGVISFTI